MVKHKGVLDVAHHHAVVINDDDARAGFQQLRTFHKVLGMRVHHDEQALRRGHGHGLRRGDKHMGRIFALVLNALHDRACQRLGAIDNDVGRHAERFCHGAPQADGRADGVKIGELVAHEEHAVAPLRMVRQRGGDDARAHLIALFHALGKAAEEGIRPALLFYGHLIAAAAQRHVERGARPGLRLLQGGRTARHTHGDGGAAVAATFDAAHGIEHLKPLFHGDADVAFIREDEIPAAGKALAEAAHGVRPLVESRLHLRGDAGILHPTGIAGKLLAVIEVGKGHNGTRLLKFAVDFLIVCIVNKVQDKAMFRLGGKHGELAVLQGEIGAASFQELLHIFRVDEFRHTFPAQLASRADGGEKRVVHPKNVARLTDDGHRHGEILEIFVFLHTQHGTGALDSGSDVEPEPLRRDGDGRHGQHGCGKLHVKQNIIPLKPVDPCHDKQQGGQHIKHRGSYPYLFSFHAAQLLSPQKRGLPGKTPQTSIITGRIIGLRRILS